MDELGTGVVTKITDGRFDNQYEVEITLTDGTKLSAFDGISVYEKKKDGSEAKVWPLVQESKFQGKAFTWQGNVRETETKAGPKRYATVVWANPVDENGEGGDNGSGWGQPPENSWEEATPSPSSDRQQGDSRVWGSARGEAAPGATPSSTTTPSNATYSKDDYWAKREAMDEVRTREIEAAWALGVLLPLVGNNPDVLQREAHKLIVLKHQIASELADG